jgi:hypothetical protein
MASLPKKVFEHFSRGIIHKNEIYVYLFMTFTINTVGRSRNMVCLFKKSKGSLTKQYILIE